MCELPDELFPPLDYNHNNEFNKWNSAVCRQSFSQFANYDLTRLLQKKILCPRNIITEKVQTIPSWQLNKNMIKENIQGWK